MLIYVGLVLCDDSFRSSKVTSPSSIRYTPSTTEPSSQIVDDGLYVRLVHLLNTDLNAEEYLLMFLKMEISATSSFLISLLFFYSIDII